MLYPQQRLRLLRLAVVVVLIGCSSTGTRQSTPRPAAVVEAGPFAHLPLSGVGSGGLRGLVGSPGELHRAHGGTRHPGQGDVRRHSQCHHGHARGRLLRVNWCAALAAARAAGYRPSATTTPSRSAGS